MRSALLLALVASSPIAAQVPCDSDSTAYLYATTDNTTITLTWTPLTTVSPDVNVVRDGVVIATIPATADTFQDVPDVPGAFTYRLDDPACGYVTWNTHTYAGVDVSFSCSDAVVAPGGTFSVEVSMSSSFPVSMGSIGVAPSSSALSSTSATPSPELLATAPDWLTFHADPGGPSDGWLLSWLDAFNAALVDPIPPTTGFPVAVLEGVVDPSTPVGTVIELEVTGVSGPGMLLGSPVLGLVGDTPGASVVPATAGISQGSVLVDGVSFRRGDANGSGAVGIDDVIFMLEWMMALGPEPGCLATTDVLGNGEEPILAEVLTLLSAIHYPTAPDPIPGCHFHDLGTLTCDDPGTCP